jgi:hypothetical protein
MLRVKQRVEKKERVESMIKPHMLKKLYGKLTCHFEIMVQGIMEGEIILYLVIN